MLIFQITPLKPGRARVSVVDGCLPKEARTAAIAEITVLGIGSVVVTVASQVQEGDTIDGSLIILGTNGQHMTPPSAILVKHKADTKIKVVLSDSSPLNFHLTGVNIGDAELQFIVDDVRSQPTSIYVFPPIRVCNVLLASLSPPSYRVDNDPLYVLALNEKFALALSNFILTLLAW